MSRILNKPAGIVLIAFCVLSSLAYGQSYSSERILSFHSDINVSVDSSCQITETIKVYALGDRIKRGIYRDFPTTYRDPSGNIYRVGFEVLDILKNGLPEPYHVESRSNGKRIYIGAKDVYLPSGEYTYTITYMTTRQIGYFRDFDELYWNVTGNNWAFPIMEASASVLLPEKARSGVLKMDGYTGRKGEKGRAFTVSEDGLGLINFRTTTSLQPGEGFTIAVSWPKGIVKEPNMAERAGYILSDNLSVIFGLAGLMVLLAYYLIAWYMVGRDPSKGTIIPLYGPPLGLSPPSARYILKMGYDDKVLASAVISMASKGYLTIEEEGGGYSIKRTGEFESVLSKEEASAAKKLFSGAKTLKLKNTNYQVIQKGISELKNSLKTAYEKVYFLSNSGFFIVGLSVSAAVVAGTCLLSSGKRLPIALFISVWLTIWTLGVSGLLGQVLSLWKTFFKIKSSRPASGVSAVILTIFSLPFLIGEGVGIGVLISATSVFAAILILMTAIINIIFFHLLKAPTLKGRKIMDQLEGFRMYLATAEKERLNLLNPPEDTPELFEKYLPYAFALDVEQAWSERFSGVLMKAAEGPGQSYSPAWYHGSSWSHFSAAGMCSALSTAVTSSSHAPGSSSGSGGGGSSGGGGGGGGGGGW